jgi:hypothetical protein
MNGSFANIRRHTLISFKVLQSFQGDPEINMLNTYGGEIYLETGLCKK